MSQYNPDQFEIVAFRKGNDGKDLVYSFNDCSQSVNVEREQAADGAAVLPHTHQTQTTESYDDVIRPVLNGKKLYRRITIRIRQQFPD